MYGGGLLGLKPGEWSWDTAMMLMLGDNLVDYRAFDPRRYLEELVHHRDTGSYSPFDSTNRTKYQEAGQCSRFGGRWG